MQTFINLPLEINQAIFDILSRPENSLWPQRAQKLHERYMEGKKHERESFVRDLEDVAAYLGMRLPATYAQIYSALSQIQEVVPEWHPTSVLDLGSGPGTGVWAAKDIWPAIENATCIDGNRDFVSIGKGIAAKTEFPLKVSWEQASLNSDFGSKNNKFDLVIIGSVLNELQPEERAIAINRAFSQCSGIMVIIEPGTPKGFELIQTAYKSLNNPRFLIAPYLENTFIESEDHWIHFPQRFIRPKFQRRLRQQMRESQLMASDWEETKYSYLAVSKFAPKTSFWGRLIGPIKKQKAWFDLIILTEKGIEKHQILKRRKEKYNFAKDLKWGALIKHSSDIL